jgi:hypothetical protein
MEKIQKDEENWTGWEKAFLFLKDGKRKSRERTLHGVPGERPPWLLLGRKKLAPPASGSFTLSR